MIHPVCVSSRILRFENDILNQAEDLIVTEMPITIMLNQEEFATLVCSPEYIEELVIGFLASKPKELRSRFLIVSIHGIDPAICKSFSKYGWRS